MTRIKIVMILMIAVGAVLLLVGVCGAYSLHAAAGDYERTTGTVRRIQTTRIYRQKKLRYDSKMWISYSTARYGELTAVVTSHCPFRSEGDKVVVWYRPDRPRDILRPRAELITDGLLAAAGLICLLGGLAGVRMKAESGRTIINQITN